jgi:hypothetical protein
MNKDIQLAMQVTWWPGKCCWISCAATAQNAIVHGHKHHTQLF